MSNNYLSTTLRRALEKAAKDARIVAEEGALDAIRRLGVADSKAPAYLKDEEKELRRRLRAHARALGDAFDKSDETQETKRLVEASAYAHWHRMLFARFLAERGLLRNPEYDVPVSLEDCRELAEAEGLTDAWAIAERYAASMLPAVFRIDDPVLALQLDPVHTQKLHKLVTGLDAEIFQAEDSLGWTYQFWRAAEKDAVNASGVKIGADELPAVTQLFTEPYMVRFLLHNTLGAWWAGKVLAADPALAQTAVDEDALRAACSLPDYSFDMLRFVREGETGPWRPASGTFSAWPKEAKAITTLDPCCGSGHFLTEALAILAALRQAEDQMSSAAAVSVVLSDNLHGLEIDGRCVQIAAFSVALTAWRIGGWQPLPRPHIAWVGAPPPLPKADFVNLASGDTNLQAGMAALYDLFEKAPELGSLLDPRGGDFGDHWRLGNLEPLLEALVKKAKRDEIELSEGSIAARGMADAASILSRTYTLQFTNVPFLGQGKQSDLIAEYITLKHFNAKADLASAMLSRMRKFSQPGGTIASVSPQGWWYLGRFKKFRMEFFEETAFRFFVSLGNNSFQTPMYFFNIGMTIIDECSAPSNIFASLDVNDASGPEAKADGLRSINASLLSQSDQFRNPDHRISSESAGKLPLLEQYVTALSGCSAGDAPRYIRKVWEVANREFNWEFHQSTVSETTFFSGKDEIIFWQNERGAMYEVAQSVKHLNHAAQNWLRGKPNWGRQGVCVSQMGALCPTVYTGEIYDCNACALVPNDAAHLAALWCFCSSGSLAHEVRKLDRSLKVTPKSLIKIPFDIEYWKDAALRTFPDGLPEPWSSDPTQWLFHGHPGSSDAGTALHVALARLLGYQWPAETDHALRLSDQARAWVAKSAELPAGDNDGLVGVPPVAGEKSLADRLRAYLAASFDGEWSDALEGRLVSEADDLIDKKVARDGSLESWVRDRAFRQHCALFGQRPFLWHITDGLKDGFSVFVHYHRFDQANLRKLTYTLLGDWLARAKAENNALRYEKGRELQQTLEKVLEGEKPYDIFVRWKTLAQQPLGWEPDLDDGVRQNIRPFIKAGVLTHDLSKILKDKDRGNDVASAPWYPVFKGERRNDHHTTLAEKHAASEAAGGREQATK